MSQTKQIIHKKANKSKDKNVSKSKEQKNNQNSDFKQRFQKMDLQPLKAFDVPVLKNITDKFRKDIEAPIELQTSIFNSKSPQRCLEHNNVSTLYCISDKKPLCVTCMYQNNSHKKHKVVPLNRASRELEDQQKKDLQILNENINLLDTLINRSHANLSKSQKEFPSIVGAIHQFYNQLQQLLSQKRNQQISHVQLTWQKMRYEYSSLATELSRIKIFILQQVRDMKKRQGEQFLLFNRNICNNLVHIENIISPHICQYHETTYYQDIKKFRDFEIQIGNQLVLTSPFKEKVRRDNNQKSKKHLKTSNEMNLLEKKNSFQRKDTKNNLSPTPNKGIENKRVSVSPQPKKTYSPMRSPHLQTPIKY